MTKAEFINRLAGKTAYMKSSCDEILGHVFEIIKEELKAGGEVSLPSVGKLKIKTTKERKGRNPRTGEALLIPAGKKVVFSIAKELKERL